MATSDYVPSDDAGLVAFVENIQSALDASESEYGLLPADSVALGLAMDAFKNAYVANNIAQNAARSSRQLKDTNRDALVTKLRSLVNRIQAYPGTTDAKRTTLNITVRDSTPTAVPAPTTQPVLFVDTSNRLQHSISFRDSLTPTSKAKPQGVLGCEIYPKIVDPTATPPQSPPSSIADCEFLGLDSASPYVADYGAETGGKTAYYIGRWANRNGLTGPQSDIISATVVA